MKKIFYDSDKIWKGFEAPEKPDPNTTQYSADGKTFAYSYPIATEQYEKAYAAARDAALPILNPEAIPWTSEIGVDYEWPGTWEKVDVCSEGDNCKMSDVKCDGVPVWHYELSLPAKEIGKTVEEEIDFNSPGKKLTQQEAKEREEGINFMRGKELGKAAEDLENKIWYAQQNVNPYSSDPADFVNPFVKITKEYADQQLAAFKEKLKLDGVLEKIFINVISSNWEDSEEEMKYLKENIRKLIDQL
jgi:hypothetical protein